jgi:hypothetical protein
VPVIPVTKLSAQLLAQTAGALKWLNFRVSEKPGDPTDEINALSKHMSNRNWKISIIIGLLNLITTIQLKKNIGR